MKRAVFVGGGAAGFFAAITLAGEATGAEAVVLEKGPQFLQKVRISGGGRCNVTHGLFEPRDFARRYPRGERELIGLLQRFQARDTVAWFEARGVKLKVEHDGRMFPVTDSSQTIIDCLLAEARKLGVKLRVNAGVESIVRKESVFQLRLTSGELFDADCVLLATGGSRTPAMAALSVGLGHTLVEPVPSLFTLQIEWKWLRELAGVSVPDAQISTKVGSLSERGPLLITHWGLSGPATLRLSAWGARPLHDANYNFDIVVNWLPALTEEKLRNELAERAKKQPAKLVVNWPVAPLPARLWEALVEHGAGIPLNKRWSNLGRAGIHALTQALMRCEFKVTGKSLNKDEFVTCGGVKLTEVNFKTMESRICPGLFFAGECLDIDGITGGFNFQAAWTTGWIAGKAMTEKIV
ncbi:MAG TPA: NAD(P)/FAD-dependent oxidoreductase [Verrucomicrobiae bacterium]|nr:NAD(P)/FAD-dependent oxidoreductase [Verrucomicrobiae bacterium]